MVKCGQVVFIVPYFGPFPWYFWYFLDSCKYNLDFDFLIITDNDEVREVSSNVKFIRLTLRQVRELGSAKLGIDLSLDHPYKLCDFKPAYGAIFSDYIIDYTFWGQSDVDVILGNLQNFLTDEVLHSYDYISVRHDYTSGCFSVFKNETTINDLFKRSKDYQKVFTSNKNYCYDQCNYVMDYLTAGGNIFDIQTEVDSYTHIIRRAQISGEIKPHFDFILIEGLTGDIKFNKGELIYKNTYQAILYHLFHLKKLYHPRSAPIKIPESYRISKTRIYK